MVKKVIGWMLFLGGSLWTLAFLVGGGLRIVAHSFDPTLWWPMTLAFFGVALLGGIPIYFGLRMWRRR